MRSYARAGAFLVVGTRSMKLRRFAILSSVFVCFGTSGPAFAGTLVVDNDFLDCPQADFNSIQAAVAAAQPGDKILVCPGVYTESPPPSTQAVLITKNDLRIEAQAAPGEVVLQGMGPTDQRIGFHLLDATGVLLQGFTVQQFRIGILIQGGSANTLRKNVTTTNQRGIEAFNSAANVVEQNISSDNAELRVPGGVFVSGPESTGNIVRHNEAFRNDSGIGAIVAGRGNVFFGNRSYANRNSGILNVVGSHGTVYENNHVFENAQVGILIGASNEVTARNNRSEKNAGSGIRLQNGSANSLVEKNEIFKNTLDGIQLQTNVDASIIQLNHIRESGRDGIRIADAASNGNTIERNVIRESGEHDAHDDGTANVWINNKCETEDQPGLCEHPGH
jgi:parallel beta-helix repeat protein